jgi:uncharacterized membrane protein
VTASIVLFNWAGQIGAVGVGVCAFASCWLIPMWILKNNSRKIQEDF